MPSQRTGGRVMPIHFAVVRYGLFKTACGRDTRLFAMAETVEKQQVTCKACKKALEAGKR